MSKTPIVSFYPILKCTNLLSGRRLHSRPRRSVIGERWWECLRFNFPTVRSTKLCQAIAGGNGTTG